MHQDYIRKYQILYRTGTGTLYLVQSCPKGGPINLKDPKGGLSKIEPYQLSDFGISTEPLQFEEVKVGQKLVSFAGDIIEVTAVYTSSSPAQRRVEFFTSHGTAFSTGGDGIGQYRIHTPATKEDMRFNVPTTTAATSFSTVNPADAVVLEAAPERITELGEDEEVTPSRLLLTLPAEVVQSLAHAELARDRVFTGDCTLDQIATDRLERILPRLVGLLTEDEVPKRDW